VLVSTILLPTHSETFGWTELPVPLSLSIRLGIPAAIRKQGGSVALGYTFHSSSRYAEPPILPYSLRVVWPWGWATMNSLSRVCGAPKAHADSTDHSASNPPSAKSRRTRSNPRSNKPVVFSTTTKRGRRSQMILNISHHKLERSPSIPIRLPAALTSWHGNPPLMTSTRSSLCIGRSLSKWSPHSRMSPNRSASGKCLARTRLQYSSISTCQMVFIPARSKPKSKPPIPANKLPCVNCVTCSPHCRVASTHTLAHRMACKTSTSRSPYRKQSQPALGSYPGSRDVQDSQPIRAL
jgi:hypothetical protein